jgi:hypothetical protein
MKERTEDGVTMNPVPVSFSVPVSEFPSQSPLVPSGEGWEMDADVGTRYVADVWQWTSGPDCVTITAS